MNENTNTILKTSLLATVLTAALVSGACGKKKGGGAAATTPATTTSTALQTTVDECNKKTDLTERRDCLNKGYRAAIDKCYTDHTESTKRHECIVLVREKYNLTASTYTDYFRHDDSYNRYADPFYLTRDEFTRYRYDSHYRQDPWVHYYEDYQRRPHIYRDARIRQRQMPRLRFRAL